ncbi:MAG: YdcF family protein [Candidatus Rokubacteria bacterium]|nr:YdcF family protein [Candidatus Rokubacteria bacterium]
MASRTGWARLRPGRRGLWLAAVCLILLLGIWLSHPLWLPLPAEWLAAGDPPTPADAIVVLSGRASERAPLAARLYQQGFAPLVITLGGREDPVGEALGTPRTEAALNAAVLRRNAVPREAILEVPRGNSTWDEAQAFRNLARTRAIRSALLVTSALHARRARWAFRRTLDGDGISIRVVVPSLEPGVLERWWENGQVALGVGIEYLKLAYYVWRH